MRPQRERESYWRHFGGPKPKTFRWTKTKNNISVHQNKNKQKTFRWTKTKKLKHFSGPKNNSKNNNNNKTTPDRQTNKNHTQTTTTKHGDKNCPLNSVTNYGRVWSKGTGNEGSLYAPSFTLLAQHEENLPVVAGVDSVDVADAGLVAAVFPLLALVVDHSLVHAHVCTT